MTNMFRIGRSPVLGVALIVGLASTVSAQIDIPPPNLPRDATLGIPDPDQPVYMLCLLLPAVQDEIDIGSLSLGNGGGLPTPFGPGTRIGDFNGDGFTAVNMAGATDHFLSLDNFSGDSPRSSVGIRFADSLQHDLPRSWGIYSIEAAGRELAMIANIDGSTPELFGLDTLIGGQPVDVVGGIIAGTEDLTILDVTGLDADATGIAIAEFLSSPFGSNRLYTGTAELTDTFSGRISIVPGPSTLLVLGGSVLAGCVRRRG